MNGLDGYGRTFELQRGPEEPSPISFRQYIREIQRLLERGDLKQGTHLCAMRSVVTLNATVRTAHASERKAESNNVHDFQSPREEGCYCRIMTSSDLWCQSANMKATMMRLPKMVCSSDVVSLGFSLDVVMRTLAFRRPF
jgi:hypothetical protein